MRTVFVIKYKTMSRLSCSRFEAIARLRKTLKYRNSSSGVGITHNATHMNNTLFGKHLNEMVVIPECTPVTATTAGITKDRIYRLATKYLLK